MPVEQSGLDGSSLEKPSLLPDPIQALKAGCWPNSKNEIKCNKAN